MSKMEIRESAKEKMKEYAKKAGKNEVGGLILGKKTSDNDFYVSDCILLEHIRDKADFAITDEGMAEFTKTASNKVLKSVIGWWHSHSEFDTFWSTDDDATFKRLANFFVNGICVGVVINNKDEERWRVVFFNKNNKYWGIDQLKVGVDVPAKAVAWNTDDYDSKAKDVVKTSVKYYNGEYEDSPYELCEACGGYGYVKQKKHKKLINYIFNKQDKQDRDENGEYDFERRRHNAYDDDYGWY